MGLPGLVVVCFVVVTAALRPSGPPTEGVMTYPAEGEITSASAPPGGAANPPPSGEISVGTTIAAVIILLVLFAAKAGLWYRRRLRMKDEEVPGDRVNVECSEDAEMQPLMLTQGVAEAVYASQVASRGAAEAVCDDQGARQSTVAVGHGDQNATQGVKTPMQDGVVRDTNERQSTVPCTMTGETHDDNNTDTIVRCAESPTNIQITEQRPIHTMIIIATSQNQNNAIEESRTDSPVDTMVSAIRERGLRKICQKVEDAGIINNTCNNDEVGVDPIKEITTKITDLKLHDNAVEDNIHKLCMATSSDQNDTGGRQQSQELVEVKDKDTHDLTQSSSTETNNLRVNSKVKTRAADNVLIHQKLMTTQHSAAQTSDTEHDPQPPGTVKEVPRDAAKDKADEDRRRENAVDGHDAREPTISTNDSGADDSKDGVSPRNTCDPRMPQDEESHSGEIMLGIQIYKESGLTYEYHQSDSQLKDKKSKTNPHKNIDYVESRVRKKSSRRTLPL